MIKLIKLSHFEFEYSELLHAFIDDVEKRLVFISKNYDEIHLVVELVDGRVIFHPRWNVKILTVKNVSNRYFIDVNFADQLENLDDS